MRIAWSGIKTTLQQFGEAPQKLATQFVGDGRGRGAWGCAPLPPALSPPWRESGPRRAFEGDAPPEHLRSNRQRGRGVLLQRRERRLPFHPLLARRGVVDPLGKYRQALHLRKVECHQFHDLPQISQLSARNETAAATRYVNLLARLVRDFKTKR